PLPRMPPEVAGTEKVAADSRVDAQAASVSVRDAPRDAQKAVTRRSNTALSVTQALPIGMPPGGSRPSDCRSEMIGLDVPPGPAARVSGSSASSEDCEEVITDLDADTPSVLRLVDQLIWPLPTVP